MKKIYLILIPAILIGLFTYSASLTQTKLGKPEAKDESLSINNIYKKNTSDALPENVKKALNCKFCHASEYPTKKDPGLKECWRKNMVTVYHSPEEGPEVVVINEMSDNYNGVVFSHRVHSQMSQMSLGCSGCHHYNTTGAILNCKKCHMNTRTREDVSVPDLKAAYHRQCMMCHKQWNHENGCSSQCHLRKGSDPQQVIDSLKLKTHPKLTDPIKLLWETNSDAGKYVTFFHDEHTQLFKLKCNNCHGQDNCIKCHEQKTHNDNTKPIKIKKSFEDHHKPCNSCHYGNYCQKCHKDSEMAPFNHGRTSGWTLKFYHSKLQCSRCHGNSMPFVKLDNNCTSCHKNFAPGKFDHSLAGFSLSQSHKDFECNNCHANNDFSKTPVCSACHDDKSYPSQSPGQRGR